MIALIAIPLSIVVSLLWYIPVVKAQGENRTLTKKDYWKAAFRYGFLYSCLLIMVTEVTWDAIFKHVPIDGLAKDIIMDFFRAALLEEFFKFTAFKKAKKKIRLEKKIDYVLMAGLMGVMYSIFEKAALGSIGGAVIGTIIPLHIMWQMNQGAHYYEYEKAKAANDNRKARAEWLKAIPLTFLLHGCWDSAIDLCIFCANDEESLDFQLIAAVLMLLIVVGGLTYTIRTFIKMRKLAKEETSGISSTAADPSNESE